MRRLYTSLSLIFLALFVSASFFFTPQTQAASGPPLIFELATQPKTMNDYLKEYCDKRSGDLMNLETWYSGKCSQETDTLSGDGVGFSDIVILQGLEYLNGPQTEDFVGGMIRKLKIIEEIKNGVEKRAIAPSQIDLASLNNGGLLSSLGGFASKLITVRPASSMDYLAYVSTNLKNHHIINEAYAASPGYGFQSLAPILPLWRAFRNISYLLFALGFVLYGVMIMFRVRIDAKTAASVQLAIPKLIVTLLVITFSYAIVGFMIDISTVVSAMVISVLKAGGILTNVNNIIPVVAGGQSLLGAVGSVLVNGFLTVIVSPFIFFNLIIGGLVGMAASFAAIIAGTISGIGIIVTIIILIAVGISYIKLIFKLFQAFFSIIINLIFSPIILLGNLMPGSNTISSWLMSIVGNLAVFPVASFFLVLSYALMCQPLLSFIPSVIGASISSSGASVQVGSNSIGVGNNSSGGTSFSFGTQAGMEALLGVKSLSTLSNIWTPPMTIPFAGSTITKGGLQTGTYTGSSGSLMLATIGFGLLLMASKYCEMVEKALKTPPFPYGAAIGEALKSGSQGNNWLAMQKYGGLKAPTGKPLSDWYGPAAGADKPTVGKIPGGTTPP